jgi:hypothetical protein
MLAGQPERALRDLLGAESLGLPEDLRGESNRDVLECYAVLGKFGVRDEELKRRTGGKEEPRREAVARVGEEEITREELDDAIRDEEAMRLSATGHLDRKALDEAVAARLADPAKVAPTLRRLVAERALYLEALARKLGDAPDTLRQLESLRRDLLASRLVRERLLEGVTLSDEDLRDHWKAHPERWTEPEAVRFSWAPAAPAEDGSVVPGAFTAVEGWHSRGDPYPDGKGRSAEADAALFALEKGAVTAKPVKLGDAEVFLRLDEKRAERTIPFEEARDRVAQDLRQRRQAEAVDRLQTEVREKHPVEILDERLRKALAAEEGSEKR